MKYQGFIIYLQEYKRKHGQSLSSDQDKVIEQIIRALEKGDK